MKTVIPGICAGLALGGMFVGRASAGGPGNAGDVEKAKAVYKQATAEMNAGKFDDAARDYGVVYDLTKDPVLFFKIAGAQQKAGRCSVAVAYYTRYLKEAHPSQEYVEITNKRVAECGGAGAGTAAGTGTATATGTAAGTATAAGTGGAAVSTGKPTTTETHVPPPSGGGLMPTEEPAEKPVAKPVTVVRPSGQKNGAWLLVGGALAGVTLGAVAAYSASSVDNDIKDLYLSPSGAPPVFGSSTYKAYTDLVDQQNTYNHLSWVAFGVAGACAIGATVLFVRDSHHDEPARVTVVPTASPHEAGVAATLRF